MKILVTFAVEAEFAPWRSLRRFSHSVVDHVRAYETRIADTDVIALLTGIGRKAWPEATRIIWDGNVNICISSGLAGALRGEHRLGEVLAASEVHASEWNKIVPTDAALCKLASECRAKIVRAFHTTDRVIISSQEKHELGKNADAVEMESGAILLEATAFGAKVIAIRAISDTADEDLPLDFNRAMTSTGDVSIPRVALQVLAHPASLPSLIRFGRQSRRAAENLAIFLDMYVEKLSQSASPKKSAEVSAA